MESAGPSCVLAACTKGASLHGGTELVDVDLRQGTWKMLTLT